MRRQVVVLLLLLPALAASTCACGNGAAPPAPTPSLQATPTAVVRPSPTPSPPLTFDISGETFYEDPVGSERFLFEVRNTNDCATERVRATVSLRDAEGQLVASQTGYARLDRLHPGESAPVLVVFSLSSPDFASHEITIEAHRADYLEELLHGGLQVTEETTRVGEWVPYEVLGQVHNATDVDAESVTLVVACYDAQGRVVAINTGRPAQRAIGAGESSDFMVTVGAVAGEVTTCSTQVEGLMSSGD
jgi:hypothetical protein